MNVAELLDRPPWLLVTPGAALDATTVLRPGMRIPCDPRQVTVVPGTDAPPWDAARRLLEEPDA